MRQLKFYSNCRINTDKNWMEFKKKEEKQQQNIGHYYEDIPPSCIYNCIICKMRQLNVYLALLFYDV